MNAGIIINPIAGSRSHPSIPQRMELAREMLRTCDLDGEIVLTTHQGHGRDLAKRFADQGVATVVSWGGDGSMNDVASELAFGGPVLGLVPSGSGNGLARELRLSRNPRTALKTALTGRIASIDAGELADRLFFNVAGIGFDAHLAALFSASSTRGGRQYALALARETWSYEPSVYKLRSSDVAINRTAFIVALANTRQYGLNAKIAPLARPDDGLLELVVIPPMPVVSILWHFRRLFSGTLHEVPGVTMQSIREVEITSNELSLLHVDGEVVEVGDSVSARVHPSALQVRVDNEPA